MSICCAQFVRNSLLDDTCKLAKQTDEIYRNQLVPIWNKFFMVAAIGKPLQFQNSESAQRTPQQPTIVYSRSPAR